MKKVEHLFLKLTYGLLFSVLFLLITAFFPGYIHAMTQQDDWDNYASAAHTVVLDVPKVMTQRADMRRTALSFELPWDVDSLYIKVKPASNAFLEEDGFETFSGGIWDESTYWTWAGVYFEQPEDMDDLYFGELSFSEMGPDGYYTFPLNSYMPAGLYVFDINYTDPANSGKDYTVLVTTADTAVPDTAAPDPVVSNTQDSNSAGASDTAAGNGGVMEAYRQVLESGYRNYGDGYTLNIDRFAILDIDGNGVPELLLTEEDNIPVLICGYDGFQVVNITWASVWQGAGLPAFYPSVGTLEFHISMTVGSDLIGFIRIYGTDYAIQKYESGSKASGMVYMINDTAVSEDEYEKRLQAERVEECGYSMLRNTADNRSRLAVQSRNNSMPSASDASPGAGSSPGPAGIVDPSFFYGIWYSDSAKVYEFLPSGIMGGAGEESGSTWNISGDQLTWSNGASVRLVGVSDSNVMRWQTKTETVRLYRELKINSVEKTGNLNASSEPNGSIDKISSGKGSIYIGGWTFDPSAPSENLIVSVYLGVGSGSGFCAGTFTANHRRADVNNSYGCGDWHGLSITIPDVGAGTKAVYVYARDVESGYETELGHADVLVY